MYGLDKIRLEQIRLDWIRSDGVYLSFRYTPAVHTRAKDFLAVAHKRNAKDRDA